MTAVEERALRPGMCRRTEWAVKRKKRAIAGFTAMEFVVATFLGLLVVLALGRIILASQRSWRWGRDKAELQANVTETTEAIARQVRAANHLAITSGDPGVIETYDRAGVRLHRYAVHGSGTAARLQQDGTDMSPRPCLHFSVAGDSIGARFVLDMQDNAGFEVSTETHATVRNIHHVF